MVILKPNPYYRNSANEIIEVSFKYEIMYKPEDSSKIENKSKHNNDWLK